MSVQSEITRLSDNVTAALAAIADKGVTVPDGSNSDSLASLIAAIEAGGGGVGEIFGTSKYEVGAVIGQGNNNLILPKPSWFTGTKKLNVIAFTLPTLEWAAPYFTILLKIIREAVTVSGYFTNDSTSFSTNTITAVNASTDTIQVNLSASVYSIYGFEYFYILWETE